MPSAIYDRSPLRFKLPERNGGVITGNDVFPGINYYLSSSDVVLKNGYSSVFSTNFNIYSSVIAPKLVQYIPSLEVFSFTFYKGVYLYNPSIENDSVLVETERKDIFFSITGGSTFTLGDLTVEATDSATSSLNPESDNVLFYEGSYYREDLTDAFSLNGQNRTSANDNIKVSISPEVGVNRPLSYFELDGTSQVQNLALKRYVDGNEGIIIPSLKPGDYIGLYLKFETLFSIDSKPIDYAFFNLRYENIVDPTAYSGSNVFPSREIVPGRSLKNSLNQDFFIQSFALKFNTNFDYFKDLLTSKIDVFYDNYPPFFSDYRESEDL
jgi:hypothetical protein